MSLFFSSNDLPFLLKQLPERMLSLTRELDTAGTINLKADGNPALGILSIEEIVEYLYSKSVSELRSIHWIYFINRKDDWDSSHKEQANTTAQMVWVAALDNQWLKDFLLERMVRELSVRNSLAESIIKSFPQFKNQLGNHNWVRFAELAINPTSAADMIALMSLQKCITPQELFESYGLPSYSKIMKESLQLCPATFINQTRKSQESIEWIVRCLRSLSDTDHSTAISEILTQMTKEEGMKYPLLIRWIKDNFSPRESKNLTRWNHLTDLAKRKYREWLGSASYQDFVRLVDYVVDKLNLTERDKLRLTSRKDFWSNYSQRFEYIRILVPQETYIIVRKSMESNIVSDIEIITCDVGTETEVCIFAFDGYFIIEFFRGISESRIYQRNTVSENYFMGTQRLTSGMLRAPGGWRHDHAFCWQYYFERQLAKRGIFPNHDVEYFNGLSRIHGKYCKSTGLVPPSLEKQNERNRKLISWEKEMNELESEARSIHANVVLIN